MDKTLATLIQEMEEINQKLQDANLESYERGKLDGRKFVLEKEIKEFKKTQPIPETLPEIRKEMEIILGKSLFEGIEYESEYGIGKNPDETVINKIQSLKIELRELLKEGNKFQERIDEVRVELFILLEVDPYTFNKNNELIDSLQEPDKTRFANLKAKHEELMKKVIDDKKEKDPTPEPPKTDDKSEVDKIRERMAELLYKDPKKAYDGIEHENEKDPERRLTEEEIKEFSELRDKLNKSLGRTELIPVPEQKPVPVPTPEPEKKKGRLVKTWESAKKFYKKHKKAVLLVTGLVLFAIAAPHILPAIMQFNSNLWWTFVNSGATPGIGIPKFLNDINLLIGSKLGATFAAESGIWTLANGAALNAAAAEASLLASLGKVALSAGTLGVGATLAIKNAYKLAKEKIQNRRNKKVKDKTEGKDSTLKGFKDSFGKGFTQGKDFIKNKFGKENETQKDPSENNTKKSSDNKEPIPPKTTEFKNDNLSPRMNNVINYYISKGFIREDEVKDLQSLPEKECIKKFKEIITGIESASVKKDNTEPTENKTEPTTSSTEFTRTDLDPNVRDFIQYYIDEGVYSPIVIESINKSEAEYVNQNIKKDPKFEEFIEMQKEWAKEESAKGSK